MDEFRLGRREAIRVWSLLLGAAALPAALTGCDAAAPAAEGAAGADAAPAAPPRALSADQSALVAAMAEYVIPETDTPGAREARVHEFIDAVVAGFMPARARERFLAGLARVDERAQRAFGARFLATTAAQQLELVTALNDAAYASAEATFPAAQPQAKGGRPAALQEGEEGSVAGDGGAVARAAAAGPGGAWDRAEVGRESFFLTFKRLVIEGYYTSEVGSTKELRRNPLGKWLPDIPYADVGRAYA